jgi:photosystem II stability/assembly factor-like uncharacterized protein
MGHNTLHIQPTTTHSRVPYLLIPAQDRVPHPSRFCEGWVIRAMREPLSFPRHTFLLILAILLTATLPTQAQWDIQDSRTTASLRGIHNVGGGVAWASGTDGTVLRTEDGGYLWQTCATPPGAEKLDFRGIQAFDENTAIVMSSGKGDLSRLYKTTDGCRTWKLLFTNPDKEGFWDAIQFSKDHNFGALLGDPVNHLFIVMLTFDGGIKWERQTLSATEDINGESAFAASNSSLLVSRPGYRRFCTGGTGGPRVISLGAGPSDVGEHTPGKLKWDAGLFAERLQHSNQLLSSKGCFSIAEDPQGITVAVGGDYTQPNDRQDTAWTNNFINSSALNERFEFHSATISPHGYRSAVAYNDLDKSWIAVGPNGTDISRDGGETWRALKPTAAEPQDADKNWNALSLPFVVGPHGRIGKLRDNAIPTAASSKEAETKREK